LGDQRGLACMSGGGRPPNRPHRHGVGGILCVTHTRNSTGWCRWSPGWRRGWAPQGDQGPRRSRRDRVKARIAGRRGTSPRTEHGNYEDKHRTGIFNPGSLPPVRGPSGKRLTNRPCVAGPTHLGGGQKTLPGMKRWRVMETTGILALPYRWCTIGFEGVNSGAEDVVEEYQGSR